MPARKNVKIKPDETVTGDWSLVIHRVSESSAEIWVGALYAQLAMPKKARVDLKLHDGRTRTKKITASNWDRPLRDHEQRFFCLVTFTGLEPGKRYEVYFSRYIEKNDAIGRGAQWQELRDGTFRTLPKRLPTKSQASFTVGMGSCYYTHRDGGQAAGAYRALHDRGERSVQPDITFLTGDQVYLDIGFDSLSLRGREIRQRIGDDYAKHWQMLGSILTRGGTWMLPDDHEYWNDWPFTDSMLPNLLALKIPKVKRAWSRASKDAVKNIQRCQRVETFDIGKDISFCLADLRSHRSEERFLPIADFKRLIDWARNLKTPGVLVLPQPLIVEWNKLERNLLTYTTQYNDLLRALAGSGHDVVLLTGDVHFGRIARANLGDNGGRLIEIIASPLSNLTGLGGLATATPKLKPKHFPDSKVLKMEGWTSTDVIYDKSFNVSTKKGWRSSAYPKARTREHFMTVGFNRGANSNVQLTVNAWRVRERDEDNLPVRDFGPFVEMLK